MDLLGVAVDLRPSWAKEPRGDHTKYYMGMQAIPCQLPAEPQATMLVKTAIITTPLISSIAMVTSRKPRAEPTRYSSTIGGHSPLGGISLRQI